MLDDFAVASSPATGAACEEPMAVKQARAPTAKDNARDFMSASFDHTKTGPLKAPDSTNTARRP